MFACTLCLNIRWLLSNIIVFHARIFAGILCAYLIAFACAACRTSCSASADFTRADLANPEHILRRLALSRVELDVRLPLGSLLVPELNCLSRCRKRRRRKMEDASKARGARHDIRAHPCAFLTGWYQLQQFSSLENFRPRRRGQCLESVRLYTPWLILR